MRYKYEITDIWTALFPRFSGSSTTLQGRVKEMMVHSILVGLVPPGAKVPPSRVLALALGVSRNTVSMALQGMVDRGFLVARARSGLVVNGDILLGQASQQAPKSSLPDHVQWERRFVSRARQQRNISKPANWQDFPYPFVYGQFDPSLMPLKDWRSCSQQALTAPAVKRWSQDFIDRDHDLLVDQIQHRLLPARGIVARRDEILVTAGAQMACYLLAHVLIDQNTVVGIEDPGYPDARNNFKLRTKKVRALAMDHEGLLPSRTFGQCAYVYTTPSHQCPTTVTMSMARRHELLAMAQAKDVVLIEDDHESELNFKGKPFPALKSLDACGRVIYLGSLSKTLAHGLRLGFMVAPAELIREMRALRRLMTRHVAANNAHVAGLFVAQGHHDAFIRRLNLTYAERRQAINSAFSELLPSFELTPSLGGSGLWVRGPEGMCSHELVAQCEARGVLIETGDVFFSAPSPLTATFVRLGYSAIPSGHIRAGIERIQAACLQLGIRTAK